MDNNNGHRQKGIPNPNPKPNSRLNKFIAY